MGALSVVLALALFGLSALHLLWATRSPWPRQSQAELARAVAGFPGIDTMPPPAACIVVAFGLAIMAADALALGRLISTILPVLTTLIGVGSTAIFLGRGVAGYVPAWRRLTPEEPFATLDPRYYSPLCLLLGAGFLCLLLGRAI